MQKEHLINEQKIRFVKETFTKVLSKKLDLTLISAPLMVLDGTGINDDLSGLERPVRFPIKALEDQHAVVVHSLAKWKRMRLKTYQINQEQGILTNMNALRPDEEYSAIHSVFVDQWDWEIRMNKTNRTIAYLKQKVVLIYESILKTEHKIVTKYPEIKAVLPKNITFIHAEQLLERYPNNTAKEREDLITKLHKAVFIIGIGGFLKNGTIHDNRAADYDDWSTETEIGKGLNGDLLVWNEKLNRSFELSSMGIRVDKMALLRQLKERKQEDKLALAYHQMILNDELPLSIGGGIGQSRLCMFLLQKQHVGEVQVSLWNQDIREQLVTENVYLL